MTIDELRSLVAYNRWATARLLASATSLTLEELSHDLRGSFVALHHTFVHILWGERGWLHFWREGTFLPSPMPREYPDLAAIRTDWTRHDDAYATYLAGLTQAELDAPRVLDDCTYTFGELVQHALIHSMHHRGQVALLLRQLGHTPPSVDYRDFLAGTRSSSPV